MSNNTKNLIAAVAAILLVVLIFSIWRPFAASDDYTYQDNTLAAGSTALPDNNTAQTEDNKDTDEKISESEAVAEPVNEAATETESDTAAEPVSGSDAESAGENTLRFRNNKLLMQHYEKHGKDMGFSSAKEYENAAAAVVSNPDALHKREQEDGDDVYYVEDTNEFVVVSTDGYIRTYFLPDSGIKYFNRQ